MKLHDWLYELIEQVSFDRDYLYLSYIRHFTALMSDIIEQGKVHSAGTYHIPGMKSNLQITLHWKLDHRLTWSGSNELLIENSIMRHQSEVIEFSSRARFDLASGDRLDG